MSAPILTRRALLGSAATVAVLPAVASLPAGPASAFAVMEAAASPISTAGIPSNPYAWWVSFDEASGHFTDRFETEEAARAFAARSGGGVIAECAYDKADFGALDADTICEAFIGRNEDLGDPDGDDAFIDVTSDDWEDLAARIAPIVKAWRAERAIDSKVNVWRFADIRHRQVIASDVPLHSHGEGPVGGAA